MLKIFVGTLGLWVVQSNRCIFNYTCLSDLGFFRGTIESSWWTRQLELHEKGFWWWRTHSLKDQGLVVKMTDGLLLLRHSNHYKMQMAVSFLLSMVLAEIKTNIITELVISVLWLSILHQTQLTVHNLIISAGKYKGGWEFVRPLA